MATSVEEGGDSSHSGELKEENENGAEIIDQESDERTEEQISILNEIIDIWTSGEHSFYTGVKKVDRKKLNEWARKINDITGDIRTSNITDTNNLINVISIFIARKLGLKAKVSHCEAKNHKAPTPQQMIPLTNFIKTKNDKISMLETNLAMFICCHSSFNSCDHLIELCKNYMSDGDIISKVKLHRTKCVKIVKNVLAPYFDGDLISDIGDRKFSLLLDESNDISINKLSGIVIVYYSDTHKKVVHTYLSMVSLETCDADGIVDALKIELVKKKLDTRNLLNIGTDNVRVMIGVNGGVF
ncbi:Hypothetical predicted protein [Octopus vulgaris]|uniref:DUF4371 domain-containing protein n=1 Tax=Octopus vulgaris TaxID=6645 RepID=A0AA36B299_OCTVU|nr:Hypothetical predicted protein [Octopus vulgaris]